MMTKNYWKAFALLLCFSFTIVACDDDEDPITVTPAPAAPTGLQATSLDDETVGLRWTVSVDEPNASFSGYELTVTDAAGIQIGDVLVFASGDNSASVAGLTEGEVYTFSIVSITTDNTISDTPATVSWSPASRYTMSIFGSLDLHEFASTLASGLEVYNATDMMPATWQVASSNNTNIDIVFDYRGDGMPLEIGSPTASDFVDASNLYTSNGNENPARTTLIGKVWDNVESFDEVYDSEALDSEQMTDSMIDFTNKNGSFIFACKTTSGHFAKIMVKYANGTFLSGPDGNRAITVTVSYQSTANVPYAKGN